MLPTLVVILALLLLIWAATTPIPKGAFIDGKIDEMVREAQENVAKEVARMEKNRREREDR